jgi:hypothetical protein
VIRYRVKTLRPNSLVALERLTTGTWEKVLSEILSRQLLRAVIVDMEELKAGLSGSSVYRVKIKGESPLSQTPYRLPSFVIKTNFETSFHQEAANFKVIAREKNNLISHFCEVKLDHVYPLSEKGALFFMIVHDLRNYRAFHDLLYCQSIGSEALLPVVEKLHSILKEFYTPGRRPVRNTSGLVKSLYTAKMERTLRSITLDKTLRLDPKLINKLRVHLNILSIECDMEPYYVTPMHGDLHAGNVMVHSDKKNQVGIKFIDIDNFNLYGDYMYDLGELAAHLEIVGPIHENDAMRKNPSKYVDDISPDDKKKAELFESKIKQIASELAPQMKERNWAARYLLSKARFLLTCSSYENNPIKAQAYFNECLKHTSKACELV